MSILLAGGAGYIGSHTAVELIRAGYEVVIADNYDNSCPEVINRIERITGTRPAVYEANVKNAEAMRKIFSENAIDVVIHFAGLKAVGESVQMPVKYYRNNIDTTEEFNMGTGTPYSVIEIVNAFEEANGIHVNHEFGPRRPGDLPECWADTGKAERVLGWKAERGLVKMCRDKWNWQKNNPEGYR